MQDKFMNFSKYSGGQKGWNDFVSNFTNKVVSSFLGTTVLHHCPEYPIHLNEKKYGPFLKLMIFNLLWMI